MADFVNLYGTFNYNRLIYWQINKKNIYILVIFLKIKYILA